MPGIPSNPPDTFTWCLPSALFQRHRETQGGSLTPLQLHSWGGAEADLKPPLSAAESVLLNLAALQSVGRGLLVFPSSEVDRALLARLPPSDGQTERGSLAPGLTRPWSRGAEF